MCTLGGTSDHLTLLPRHFARVILRSACWRRVGRMNVMSVSGLAISLASLSLLAGQTVAPPLLTVDDAVAIAMKDNRRVQSSGLEVHRAEQGTAAARTQRLPQ